MPIRKQKIKFLPFYGTSSPGWKIQMVTSHLLMPHRQGPWTSGQRNHRAPESESTVIDMNDECLCEETVRWMEQQLLKCCH